MRNIAYNSSPNYVIRQGLDRLILVFRRPTDNLGLRGKRRTLFEERRANILATARRMLAEEGYPSVVIRKLAERSGVTPPTIYNLVGTREKVLQSAVIELLDAKIDYASKLAREQNINGMLAYGETLWRFLVYDPQYSRQLILACFNSDTHQKILNAINTRRQAASYQWLSTLHKEGHIQHQVDLTRVTDLILRHTAMAVLAWAEDQQDVKALRTDILAGISLTLSTFVDSHEQRRIQHWIQYEDSDIAPSSIESRLFDNQSVA